MFRVPRDRRKGNDEVMVGDIFANCASTNWHHTKKAVPVGNEDVEVMPLF